MKAWVKTGRHDRLNIRVLPKQPLEDAGGFTGGGWKLLWHTTEGGTIESVIGTLRSKRAGVHFVFDPRTGTAVQCIPLTHAGRGLEHPANVTATNSANVIQVEIVGFARESGNWPESYYQHLAGLALLIERYLKASDRKLSRKHRRFERPVKFDSRGFISFSGHCGHVHVPGNSHYDPGTGFRGRKLIHEMAKLEKQEKR